MKKILYILCCYSFFYTHAQGNFVSSNLPIISINTNGQFIDFDAKIVADMAIRDNGTGVNKLTDTPIYEGKIGIEYRGSSSIDFSPRKPYSIETREDDGVENKNVALLGMAKENDWALIAPYADKTLIRDAFLYALARKTMTWASDFRFADVFVNGKYEGIYMMTEKIKQGKNRVNIDKMEATDLQGDELTGGYIFAFDKLKNTDNYFVSSFTYPNSFTSPEYVIVSPKADKAASAQNAYISNWMFNFENMMNSSQFNNLQTGYPKWLDVNSFVDFALLNELSRNIDGYRLSTYFYKDKDSKDNRLHAGPVWDFNLGFGNANYCSADLTTGWAADFNKVCGDDNWVISFWWQKLFNDAYFRGLMKKRWQELRKTSFSDGNLLSTIDSLQNKIGDAQTQHFKRYPILNEWVWPNAVVKGSYIGEMYYLKNWTTKRTAWLDAAFNDFTTIENITTLYDVLVYPNPAQDVINFEVRTAFNNTDFNIKIFDAKGVFIKNEKYSTVTRWNHNIDVSIDDFQKGLYYYQFYQDGEMIKAGTFMKN